MPRSSRTRRILYLLACLAPAWALIVIATGGTEWMIGPLRMSFRQWMRPLLAGAVVAAYYFWRYSRSETETDGRWLEGWLSRGSIVVLPIVLFLGCFIGVYYGSFAAAGSDSYGYVSQASLWLRGSVRVEQPWVQQFSWPEREWTFAPLGYRPLSSDGTIIPTYAPGLPIVMAVLLGVVGDNGPFLVVPIMGAFALWFTYLLGKEATGSRAVGAGAALMLLASPVFLAHLMLPMTDVPVAAGWTLVCLLATRPRPRALAAGIVAAATLLIRPNLPLLALAPVIAWTWPSLMGRQTWRPALTNVIWFGVGLAPAVVAVAALNASLYGSPFVSGYGRLSDMYWLSSAPPNLRNFGTWLLRTETPLVALALIPIFVKGALRSEATHASMRAAILALIALTLLSYVFYTPFEIWSYLRFLLPALPSLFVLMMAGTRWATIKLPLAARAPAAALLCLAVVAHGVRFSREQFVFDQSAFEQRYIRAAEHVARLTPENAVIICVQHSGSLRYYSRRITLRYDYLYGHRLDTTLRELVAKGYRPYIVVDDWEETVFRNRFAKQNRAGSLDWKPLVRVLTHPEVRIYDPEGRFE
jgi:hypothetical protein